MSSNELPPEADVEEISLSIADGLKSCRSMIANYRAMISGDGEANDNLPKERAANDEGSGAMAPGELG